MTEEILRLEHRIQSLEKRSEVDFRTILKLEKRIMDQAKWIADLQDQFIKAGLLPETRP